MIDLCSGYIFGGKMFGGCVSYQWHVFSSRVLETVRLNASRCSYIRNFV